MEMISIENEHLRLGVNLRGGCMASIQDKDSGNEELLYQPDPRSWSGQDVVIFPFIARLKNQTYIVDGKEYSMKNHGLARYRDFRVIEKRASQLVLEFDSDEETLKQYPYEFRLVVTYTLEEKSIHIQYKVISPNGKTLYFGLGGHPALKVDVTEREEESDSSGNYLVFDHEMDLTKVTFEDTFSFMKGEEHYGNALSFELKKEMFQKENTWVFKGEDIHKVYLKRRNGRVITYCFPHINFLTLWSHPHYGDYVCIEPWLSLPDFVEGDKELSKKPTLMKTDSSLSLEYTLMF